VSPMFPVCCVTYVPGLYRQAAVRKSATPAAVRTVIYHGALHAFDLFELPAEASGPAGMAGYKHRAAADAWAEAQRFLQSSR
jgi:dienelactone hydrolase